VGKNVAPAGNVVGTEVGAALGAEVGAIVGTKVVGAEVGASVGFEVGKWVAPGAGEVGARLGAVSVIVGAADGVSQFGLP
jgi:hypothetical protein